MRILFVGLSGLLVACGGITEEEFGDQVWGLTCDRAFECTTADEIEAAESLGLWFFGENAESCKALLDEAEESEDTGSTEEGDTCEFDSDKGQACLDAMAALDCESTSATECNDVCVDE
ncbi:MAG: hypothetical protein VX519_07980 [Myxococcota bacterium]|nr:hypothetical protein [Myxococcota bacterium]